MKLSKDIVASLKPSPDKADQFIWDDDLPGFGVRLRSSGARWIIQYRVGAQQRRESLGDIRKVTIEAARKIARQRFAQAELGTDPAAEKARARAEARAQKLTFGIVANQYLAAKKGVISPATYTQVEHHLLTLWAPFAARPLESIKRADVASRLREIVEKSGTNPRALRVKEGLRGKTAAARARSNLSAVFSWAMGEGMCETNPTIGTNDPSAGIKARDRVLTDHELAAVWRACEDNDFGRIVKLLILTGCRREEIGGLRWDEVDLEAGNISLPPQRTKTKSALLLPLPPVAVDILRSVPLRAGRDALFGGRSGSFCAWSYSTIALNNRIAEVEGKPLPPWVLHDLRRTTRTGLSRLGVAPHVAERVLNHAKGGIEGIYDRYSYGAEIKAALAIWADHVVGVVENRPSNIAVLRRA